VPTDRVGQAAILHAYGPASPAVTGSTAILTGSGCLRLAPRWRDYTERPF
jgi:hypothetical protein